LRTSSLAQTMAVQVHEDLRRELRTDLLAALDPERELQDGFQKQLRLSAESALTRAVTRNAPRYREIIQAVQQQRQQDQLRLLP